MEKKKTGKIVAIIIILVIVSAGTTIGVMAACGVFKSDKARAFELLAQAPERFTYSSTEEYIGVSEMTSEMKKKGSSTNLKISNLQLNSAIAPSGIDWSNYAGEIQMDTDKDKSSVMLAVSKGDSKISVNKYMDSEKVIFSLPDLLSGKSFQITNDALKQLNNTQDFSDMQMTREEISTFEQDVKNFFEDELTTLQDRITCETTEEDKNSYKLTISKEAMDTILNDMIDFMNGQTKVVTVINKFAQLYGSDTEVSFDFMSSMKEAVSSISKYTQDFTFTVYGKENTLTGLSTVVTVLNTPYRINLDFAGQKGNSTTTLKVSATENGQESVITVLWKDTKADTYETSCKVDVSVGGASIGTLTLTETMNPSGNLYEFRGVVTAQGSELGKLSCSGTIKDLKPGSCVNYVLDDVSLTIGGENYFDMAADVKLGVLDGKVSAPEGETVNITKDSDFSVYEEELMNSFAKKGSEWGFIQ